MRSMALIISATILLALAGFLPFEMVQCRPSSSVDVDLDNSISDGNGNTNIGNDGGVDNLVSEQRTLFEAEDWVKVVKAPPEKIVQQLGSTIELTCEIMGAPLPTIQWIRGHPSPNGLENLESNAISETSSTSIVRVRSVLVIDHVIPNERTYTCVGQSSGQTVFATTTIYPSPEQAKTVNFPQLVASLNSKNIGPKRPKIIYNYPMVLDNAGSNVVLPCRAIGRPRPEIYWMDSNGIINDNDPRFKILPTGELLISDLRWDDMGSYKCVAHNGMGKDIAGSFVYPVSKGE